MISISQSSKESQTHFKTMFYRKTQIVLLRLLFVNRLQSVIRASGKTLLLTCSLQNTVIQVLGFNITVMGKMLICVKVPEE